MLVRAQDLSAFRTDRAITERRALGGTCHDPDVTRPVVTFAHRATARSRPGAGVALHARRRGAARRFDRCRGVHVIPYRSRTCGGKQADVIVRLIQVAGATSDPPDGDSTAFEPVLAPASPRRWHSTCTRARGNAQVPPCPWHLSSRAASASAIGNASSAVLVSLGRGQRRDQLLVDRAGRTRSASCAPTARARDLRPSRVCRRHTARGLGRTPFTRR